MLKPSKTSYDLIQGNEMKSCTNIGMSQFISTTPSDTAEMNSISHKMSAEKECTLLCTAVASQQKMMSVANDNGWKHVILWF